MSGPSCPQRQLPKRQAENENANNGPQHTGRRYFDRVSGEWSGEEATRHQSSNSRRVNHQLACIFPVSREKRDDKAR